MILVAFVLVIVATVMLIIGTFFDAGVAYIWISIMACLATFGVLAASYLARRRAGEQPAARPQPLTGDGSRSAAVQPELRDSTLGAGGTATATRSSTATDADAEIERDEPSVTIVATRPARADDAGADLDRDDEVGEPAESEDVPAPAPRAVAPRRVVRRAAPAATTATTAPTAPPAETAEDVDSPAAAAASTDTDTDQPAPSQPTSRPTRVVRRGPAGTGATRKVVRRVPTSGTTAAAGAGATAAGTRQVVRRASTPGGGQTRTVRRVVRKADGASSPATPATTGSPATPATPAAAAQKSPSSRSGTRGKRAREVLSQVKGVGPAKQDALLKKFGSLEDIAEASIKDLTSVKGVGEAVAKKLKQTLKDR